MAKSVPQYRTPTFLRAAHVIPIRTSSMCSAAFTPYEREYTPGRWSSITRTEITKLELQGNIIHWNPIHY